MGRRESNHRPPLDFTPCGYCFDSWAVVYDHLRPKSRGGTNHAENLYPACARCNMIAGAKLFSSIEEKRAYCQKILEEKTKADGTLRRVRKGISADQTAPEILLSGLPLEGVGQTKPTGAAARIRSKIRRVERKIRIAEKLGKRRRWVLEALVDWAFLSDLP